MFMNQRDLRTAYLLHPLQLSYNNVPSILVHSVGKK